MTVLTQMTDLQLMNLFKVNTNGMVSARGSAVLTELRRRGYFFDILRSDFLTKGQWKVRYQSEPPTDYAEYWRQYAKQPHLIPR
jgi:hypothetical protein